jgi:hypothetical protein
MEGKHHALATSVRLSFRLLALITFDGANINRLSSDIGAECWASLGRFGLVLFGSCRA